jgi:serine/threonine-protein kinase RsbW
MAETGGSWSTDLTIPSERGAGKPFLNDLLSQLHHFNWPETDIFGIHLSVEEAVVNAIKHGNAHDPNKKVHIQCKVDDKNLHIAIQDEGPGFNPEDVPDCTEDENLEVPSGRGLMLMRSFMTRVEYNNCGNGVVMEKVRK